MSKSAYNLSEYSLQEIDTLYRNGRISKKEAQEYVDAWNASGKHYTVAKVYAFSISNEQPRERKPTE
jgi:hypothetical protein